MTKKTLKWRLGSLPSVEELRQLVKDKIITQDEAREILFNESEGRDEESLKEEIKFLRELVEKLSDGKVSRIVEVIKEVPVYKERWYKPYEIWCSASDSLITTDSSSLAYTTSSADATLTTTTGSFTDINTF